MLKSLIKLFHKHDKEIVRFMRLAVWTLLGFGYILKSRDALLNLTRFGDEGFFLKELVRYQQDGLVQSFADGISHLHVFLGGALAALTGQPLLAGRLLSILLIPLTLYLGYRIFSELGLSGSVKLTAVTTLAYTLVYCQTGRMFFRWLNDPLMIAFALVSLYFLLLYQREDKIKFLLLAAVSSGMTLWVRSFAVLILAGVTAFLALRFLLNESKRIPFIHLSVFLLITFCVAMLVQVPSILEYRRLSYENKGGDGSWAERNWVTRLNRQSNGGIFSYRRSSWEEVERFKKQYGNESIPSSLTEVYVKDPKFLVDNAVANLFVRVLFVLFVSTGVCFFLFLDLLRKPGWVFRRSALSPGHLFLAVIASVSLGLSVIIINYIEHRWLFMAVFGVLTLGAMHLNRKRFDRIRNLLITIQWSFIFLLSVADLYQVVNSGF